MTMTDPKPTARKPDPIEAEARRIQEGWKADRDRKELARAYHLAKRKFDATALAAHDANPANWALRMRKAGATSLALAWPGAPCFPDACLPAGSVFSLDDQGVWVQPEHQPKQWVCSPMVQTQDRAYAVLVGRKWVKVPRPSVKRGTETRRYAEAVIAALAAAGATFAEQVTTGHRDDALDHRPGTVWASVWLLGIDPVSNSIGNRPVRRLSDIRPATEDGRPETTEGREILGQVLGRQPADIHPGRRSR